MSSLQHTITQPLPLQPVGQLIRIRDRVKSSRSSNISRRRPLKIIEVSVYMVIIYLGSHNLAFRGPALFSTASPTRAMT